MGLGLSASLLKESRMKPLMNSLDLLATDGAVDHYLPDQLLLPLALAPGMSEIRTSKVTHHLTTNADIVERFLPVSIEVEGKIGQPGSLRIRRNE